ncbi:nicotinate-nucleotide--dimethylbenzimidazole phosphoribosyltransferase [Streptomyces sp. NPDC101165]|uniref:nicotinate-nucleotide--dimethylbenzimidazole phosphoribosyltransferase n=1 Tax=Streptomyces sp. NPDC101165 TaxID=3366119 RepID=UPI0038239E35
MTDTGQVPGEGQPESAGMVEQPGALAHGAYTYLSEAPAEDEELLLPGAQGAWGNEVQPPAPEPVVEAVRQPGPHETAGRDSGSVDLSGVRLPNPAPASVPPSPILSAPHDAAAAQQQARRPLHLGPPIPNTTVGPVRSLADRGPAGAPVRQPGPATTGPEYLDAQPLGDLAPQTAAPWGAPPAAAPVAVAQVGTEAPAAEAVGPAAAPEAVADVPDAAQATMTRLATQAAVQVPGEAVQAQAVHGHDGVQPVHGHDGVYVPQGDLDLGQGPEGAAGFDVAAGEAADGGVVPAPEAEVAEAVPAPETGQMPPAADVAEPGAPVQPTQSEAVPVQVPEAAPVAEATPLAEVAEPVQVSEPVQQPERLQQPELLQQQEPVQQAEAVQPVEVAPVADAVQAEVPSAADAPAEAMVAAPAPVVAEEADAAAAQGVTEAAPVAPAQPGPHAVGPVEVPPAAVPAPAAPAAAQVPPAAEPAQAPEPVAAAEPVPTPEPAHAAEPAEFPEPLAPALDVVQVLLPEPTPEAPEPALLQAQGPQLAGPVPYDGDAATAPQQPQPQTSDAAEQAVVAPTPDNGLAAPAGPQLQPAEVAPVAPEAEAVTPPAPAAEPDPAAAAAQSAPAGTTEPLPSGVPLQPHPEQPLGQFVPVEGQVPTTPHLAPTPPQPLVLPVQEQQEPVATVPAPREAEPAAGPDAPEDEHAPDVVQHAEDLETRAADQEESTAAVEEAGQSTGPAAPAYDDAEREAVLKVMRERRDIRNGFRSDPIPHEVLLRVLEAAHTAPSVGHSQPWDFVVIRSADTRRTMHELAMRQRDAYAKSLPKGRAKQFKELKIEAILDTPVNIVVTADPTRGGRHTLGRHTQPQMAPYSAALAVENLWLAARAEGLGVGWVSFFDEREMVRALGLPEHLEVIAYLCVGYVDEFPDEPELMQAGWSKRRPLSWVVHEETYGRRALPGEEPHDLLAETVAQIRPLDAKALGEAWERQKRMTKPAGALGMLEIISAQLSGLSRQCPPPIPEPAAVAIFAGDHGVHAQGVTPWPQEVTAQMVANFLGGGAVCNAFANQVGAEVCVVDVGVAADLPATPGLLPRKIRGGTSDMTTGPAMTREEAKAAIEVGIETARDLVAAGNKALLTGEMGIANTTASAALISVFTGADPAEVTGRGTGINDETLARKTEVVRRALEVHQPDPADPIGVLAAIGGFEHAALVGLLLGGSSLRTPVILDGVSAGAAALVARAIAPEVLAACIAGHRSAEPGHVAALNKLGLRPLVDLDLRLGEGTGALLALPLVQSTARAMHEVATFDSAGVTEK